MTLPAPPAAPATQPSTAWQPPPGPAGRRLGRPAEGLDLRAVALPGEPGLQLAALRDLVEPMPVELHQELQEFLPASGRLMLFGGHRQHGQEEDTARLCLLADSARSPQQLAEVLQAAYDRLPPGPARRVIHAVMRAAGRAPGPNDPLCLDLPAALDRPLSAALDDAAPRPADRAALLCTLLRQHRTISPVLTPRLFARFVALLPQSRRLASLLVGTPIGRMLLMRAGDADRLQVVANRVRHQQRLSARGGGLSPQEIGDMTGWLGAHGSRPLGPAGGVLLLQAIDLVLECAPDDAVMALCQFAGAFALPHLADAPPSPERTRLVCRLLERTRAAAARAPDAAMQLILGSAPMNRLWASLPPADRVRVFDGSLDYLPQPSAMSLYVLAGRIAGLPTACHPAAVAAWRERCPGLDPARRAGLQDLLAQLPPAGMGPDLRDALLAPPQG